MNHMVLLEHLAEAERHVFEGERRIRKQEALLEKQVAAGLDSAFTERVLEELQRTHDVQLAHRDELRQQLQQQLARNV